MKYRIIILLLILHTTNCFSQTNCKFSDLQNKIYERIELDKKNGYNTFLIDQLTLSLDLSGENSRIKEHKFSYNTGRVFRIYLICSGIDNSKPCLKLYTYNPEDKSTLPELLKYVCDAPDDDITILEYENTKYIEFILELSIEDAKSGCVMSIFTVYPKK